MLRSTAENAVQLVILRALLDERVDGILAGKHAGHELIAETAARWG